MRLNSKVVQFHITEQTIPFEENVEQPPDYKFENMKICRKDVYDMAG